MMRKKYWRGLIGLLMLLILNGCGAKGEEGQQESQTTALSESVTEEEVQNGTVKKEQELAIISYSIEKSTEGKKVLVLEYEWTNHSDIKAAFLLAFSVNVYQNGVECPSFGFHVPSVDREQQMTEVSPGTTLRLKVGYALQDKTDVRIEVTNYMQTVSYLTETIQLGEGEGESGSISPTETETGIRIEDAFLSRDRDGNEILVVRYAYTNGAAEGASFVANFEDTVLQNGTKCDSNSVYSDDVKRNSALLSVGPGVTYIVEKGYRLQDRSAVEITVKERFGDKVYVSEKREIE